MGHLQGRRKPPPRQVIYAAFSVTKLESGAEGRRHSPDSLHCCVMARKTAAVGSKLIAGQPWCGQIPAHRFGLADLVTSQVGTNDFEQAIRGRTCRRNGSRLRRVRGLAMKTGTLHAMCRQLGITRDDL